MEKEKLKEYLGIVVDLEKDIFVKKQIISELKSKIGTLCKPGDFYRPIKPSKPTPKQTAKSGPLDILCIPVIIVVAIISLAFLVGFVLIPAIIFIILSERKKDKKEYRSKLEKYYQKLDQYENAMEEYQRNISSDQQRIEQESLQKEALQADLTKLQAYLVETQDTLSKIYNKNIIFPKYRNFVMVSSLYEYICAGRCTALEGHEGAYNILEMEIRLDHVITQLGRIITQLEVIKSNQYIIYSAIQDANRQSAQILESTNRMAESIRDFHGDTAQLNAKIAELQQASVITAYHTERTQKELAHMNRMNYLTGRNDGPFWNVPPT